jgi:hypothetical protein
LSDSVTDDFAIFNFKTLSNEFIKVKFTQIAGYTKKYTAISHITLGTIAGGNLDSSADNIFCPMIARFDGDLV